MARGRKKKVADPKEVVSYRHEETRANNPQVGMVHAESDPDQPKTEWQYDPHLDPELNFDSARVGIESLIDGALASGDADDMRDALQELKRLQAPYLNWTGKAEKTSFEIDTVSLHVHERVDPATILANAAKQLKGNDGAFAWRQANLFEAAFEQLPLRQALDFYKHEKGWSNRLITGDSLLVMNSLLIKESMGGEVQTIYIDPPYGIKYGSNFQPFTNKRDVKDRSDADLTQEPEMIKAFRDTWELGLHSYLTYLRDRLVLAQKLLRAEGSVFVQISDDNLHHVREILDEVFGAENYAGLISYSATTGQTSGRLAQITDYIVWYAKDRSAMKFNRLLSLGPAIDNPKERYVCVETPEGEIFDLSLRQKSGEEEMPSGRILKLENPTSQSGDENSRRQFKAFGKTFKPGGSRGWSTSFDEGMPRVLRAGYFRQQGNSLWWKSYRDQGRVRPLSSLWTDTRENAFGDSKVYVVQTSPTAVERCLLMTTDPGDLVFDPTCGSGTTALVAEKWGRRWITCDTSRVASNLARQRMMTASFAYYILRYPHEGIKGGFDYETVKKVSLKDIAHNADIDEIYADDHPRIEVALQQLNDALTGTGLPAFVPLIGVRKGQLVNMSGGEALHEWEVPFNWPESWPAEAREAWDVFHSARQAMQTRMDQSIADHADQEPLFDKPRIDKTKLRITGPFSVEAVPAPTVLSLDETQTATQPDETIARSGATSLQAQWREELVKTGVRAKAGAMMTFAEFETLPGTKHLHASGSVADTGERVVVSFGPQHAALEQRQVELALAEAEKLRPSPKFVLFCAFTFDPEAAKDIDEVNWPGVTLLKAQMNTDLLTEDLKKKRSSNESFWLMGQPEVHHWKNEDGQWQVEVLGFDYFDPRKGDVVSGGTKQIAMWSLDVDYDERSMMPHQVFFPMAGKKDGWNRLKKTIRAELDEELLEQFHGTVSLPFEAGGNAKAAVKIVDDRGIESFKIIPLEG